MVLWEIVGRYSSAAFMVPLSETLLRLEELAVDGELLSQLEAAVPGFSRLAECGCPAKGA